MKEGERTTATTRIIPLHLNKGKTLAACLSARIDYATNPDKTENYERISAYECNPHTADAEFLFSKRQYEHITGRTQKNNVIAYQIRQSFKPGEVTPEEANQIGYELAMRFLKGNHAFMVCTHVDKKHIHSHIIFNSTTLDCTHKFRDFLGSGKAIGRLSDIICMEHGLSIIEKPKRYTHPTYDKWQEEKGVPKKPSNREQIRVAIDTVLVQTPPNMQAILRLLEEAGYTIRRGKHISLRHPDFKRAVRLDSLGDGYTEDAIMAVLAGTKEHKPRQRKKNPLAKPKNSLLIDIEAKLQEGKGGGYKLCRKPEGLQEGIVIRGVGNAVLDGGLHNGLREDTAGKDGMPMVFNNLTIYLHHVKDFRIEGLHIVDQRWWAIACVFCWDGVIENLHFAITDHSYRKSSPLWAQHPWRNQDGVDLRIGCHDIQIRNLTGETCDDVVALTALGVPGSNRFEDKYRCDHLSPDIRKIPLRPSCFRLRPAYHHRRLNSLLLSIKPLYKPRKAFNRYYFDTLHQLCFLIIIPRHKAF